jgi:hypothetical protein
VAHGFRNRISKIADQVFGEKGRGAGASRDDTGAPLPTRNREWGFFGTAVCSQGDGISQKAAEEFAAALWSEVATWLIGTFGASPATVRAFLDSKWGRHMADAGVVSDFAELRVTTLCTFSSSSRQVPSPPTGGWVGAGRQLPAWTGPLESGPVREAAGRAAPCGTTSSVRRRSTDLDSWRGA